MKTKDGIKVAQFTCFVDKDVDVSPEALKVKTPHVYRGVRYTEEDREAIERLFCLDKPLPFFPEGTWLFERSTPKGYTCVLLHQDVLDVVYKEFDASGILGCGKGSERFN